MNFFWDNIFRKTSRADDLRAILKANVLFQDLTASELSLLENLVHSRRYHAGEPIFKEGEIGLGMYMVVTGRVDIFVADSDFPIDSPKEIFITQLSPGDFFGEIALVEENGRRTASAVAREESQLLGFFKPDLQEILKRNPSLGIKIILRLAEVLGRRLKETTGKVSELRAALKDLREPPPSARAEV